MTITSQFEELNPNINLEEFSDIEFDYSGEHREIPRSKLYIDGLRFRFSDRNSGFYMDVWYGDSSGYGFQPEEFLESRNVEGDIPAGEEEAVGYASKLLEDLDHASIYNSDLE